MRSTPQIAIGIATLVLLQAIIFLHVNEVLGHTTSTRSVFCVVAIVGGTG